MFKFRRFTAHDPGFEPNCRPLCQSTSALDGCDATAIFYNQQVDANHPKELKIESEIANFGDDWDYVLTDEDLQAIDAVSSAYSAPAPAPIRKRQLLDCTDDRTSPDSHPMARRRLPQSLFSFTPCSRKRFYSSTYHSPFQDIKFGGRIVYSRTMEEVEKAAEELLHFVEAKKSKEEECILGLDIEWRPSFRKGVKTRKAAVMQICEDMNRCHVFHIIHSQIPKNLQCLLEDASSLKVGVGIASDAAKVNRDHNVSINGLEDLSNLANRKLCCAKLHKPKTIRTGNWEVGVLSKDQLNYAATDAYVSWYLYQVLKNLPDPLVETGSATETVVASD